ncbi:MAG: hypothetical protein JNL58_12295 [Planctomyces sp.]|nr:hypothetical protein [Planctomyces sp.]
MIDWRNGIIVAVMIDAVSDLIRKVTPGEPLWVSHAVVATWACIIVSALSRDRNVRIRLMQLFPGLRSARGLIILALLPAAGISLAMYKAGWFLVLIGGVSYGAPLLGIMLGAQFARDPRDVRRFMAVFAVANGIMLLGSLAEQFHWNWPGLGGLKDMVWVRHMPGVLVRLISGFYRSPDMAGFHAAHVAIFSLLLAAPRRPGDAPRLHWIPLLLLGVFCLFLSGRRKMFGLPVVFLISWVVLNRLRRGRQRGAAAAYLILWIALGLAVTMGFIFFVSGDVSFEDHGIYLSTTIADTAPKLWGSVDRVLGTLRQSGVLGSGLGVATQGNKYAGVQNTNAWQEDGTSRIVKELGLPGMVLMLMAGLFVLNEVKRSLRFSLTNMERDTLRTATLAVFIANAASYIISHQHISGSVPNAMLPILMLGAAFGQVVFSERQGPAPAGGSTMDLSVKKSPL